MAVPNMSGIESVLQQMRAVVSQAEGRLANPADLAPMAPTSFSEELARSIKRVSDAQNAAGAQAKAFEMGDPNVSLNDVMIDLQKASIGFQTAIQVRSRLVQAYREISSMAM